MERERDPGERVRGRDVEKERETQRERESERNAGRERKRFRSREREKNRGCLRSPSPREEGPRGRGPWKTWPALCRPGA